MVRRIVVLAVAILVAMGGVAHAQYNPGQPGFTLNPPTLPDTGGTTVITGVGCPANSTVDAFILVNGSEIAIGSGKASPDPDGGFSFTVTVPPVAAGEYTVIVRCGNVTLSNILTITGTAVTPQPGPLPRTGADVMGFVRVGLALVAVGGLLLLGERKRRRHPVT